MRALVTGATGFIGRRLVASLDAPAALSRDPARARQSLPGARAFAWEPAAGPPPAEAFAGVDAVFHLAGDPVAGGRWTARKKARVRDSRVLGTRHLVSALAGLPEKPRALVAASAVGFYGDRGDEVLDESSSIGSGFLAEVCRDWEAEASKAADLGLRVVHVRIGVVLGEGGGALEKMLLPFRLGLGGRLGSGRQWLSWIHLDDLAEIFLLAARNEDLSGPVNGVAPNPVTNTAFTRTLASVLGRPAIFPVPALALRLATGEFAGVLLASQRVLPRAARGAGFTFRHPALEGALREILTR
jgi:uncharacterized protein (TIGR01777 family)